jgi:competence protein ComEC
VVAATYGFLYAASTANMAQIPHRQALLAGQKFPVEVTGIVTDAPRKLANQSVRFPLRVKSMTESTGRTTCDVPILVTVFRAVEMPTYGDRVRLSGMLGLPPAPLNPGQFDSRKWITRSGLSGDLLASGSSLEIIGNDGGTLFKAAALASRFWIRERLTMGLEDDPATASVITAMVLGLRDETPDAIEDAFVGSGTMHVFAVSGLHVGLFGFVVWTFLKAFGVPRRWAIFLIIPGMLFYAFVTGLRPSACRAAIMASIVLSGFLVARLPSLPNSLGAAALCLLAYDPLQLFQPGFQLSFLVLASIALVGGRLRKPLGTFGRPDPFIPRSLLTKRQRATSAGGRWLGDMTSVSVAAWLGSAPLMFLHFKIGTPVAIVANCFLVPLAFGVLFTASVSLTLGSVLGNWAAVLCNNTNWAFAKLSVLLAGFFAGLPGGNMTPDPPPTEKSALCATVLALDHGGGATHVAVHGGSQWLIDLRSSKRTQADPSPLSRAQTRHEPGWHHAHARR